MTPKKFSKFRERSYRNGYVKATVEQGVSMQLRALRQARGLTQRQVAIGAGLGSQSAVARLEDPSYAKMSIPTLLKLGEFFDVALAVRFVSYSRFLKGTRDVSEEALKVPSFEEEDASGIIESQFLPSNIAQHGSQAVISTIQFNDSNALGSRLMMLANQLITSANMTILEKTNGSKD